MPEIFSTQIALEEREKKDGRWRLLGLKVNGRLSRLCLCMYVWRQFFSIFINQIFAHTARPGGWEKHP